MKVAMLLTLYSSLVVVVDLLVLQVRLLFSLLMALLKIVTPSRLKSLANENVVVTGAGHGIGQALAIQLAAQGARVALWDVDAARCEQTAREIRSKGGRAMSYCCDVADRDQVLDTASRVRREFGVVGLVINNAGIVPIHPVLAHNPQQICRVFDVNVISHFWMLEAFLPGMIASNHGHFAAVGSMTALVGSSNMVPYSASKFAVRGLMQALAEELQEDPRRPKINLTTVHPFIVDTGQVERPRLRFPRLLGVQQPEYAARQIITAIRKNQTEASVPGWLLSTHNLARALPEATFNLLKTFMESGAEATEPAWHDPARDAVSLAPAKAIKQLKLPHNGFGASLTHQHLDLLGDLNK